MKLQVGEKGLHLTISETYAPVTEREKRHAVLLTLDLITLAKKGEVQLVIDTQRPDSLDIEIKKALGIST